MQYIMKLFKRHYFVSYSGGLTLKGKISSGIEGALASTFIHDFNWKQRSEIIICIFCDVFAVYLSNIDSETAEIYINKRRL